MSNPPETIPDLSFEELFSAVEAVTEKLVEEFASDFLHHAMVSDPKIVTVNLVMQTIQSGMHSALDGIVVPMECYEEASMVSECLPEKDTQQKERL